MPSVEQVKLYIGASVDQTQRAVLGMRGVVDQLEQALALVDRFKKQILAILTG